MAGVSGAGVFAVLAGSVLLYSGFKGKSISTSVRLILEGKNPSTGAQSSPITNPVPNVPGSTTPALVNPAGTGNVVIGGDWATKQYAANDPTTLSFAQIQQLWISAGGSAATAPIAAAITMPEAGRRPGAVQAGQPYQTTGWGLWQITPGNSVPSAGIDNQLLVPLNNAKAAVAKYKDAGGFSPWVTYMNGAYSQYLGAASGG